MTAARSIAWHIHIKMTFDINDYKTYFLVINVIMENYFLSIWPCGAWNENCRMKHHEKRNTVAYG
jgi:hypothetical protein